MEDLYLTKIDVAIDNEELKDCLNYLSDVSCTTKCNVLKFLNTIHKLYSLLQFGNLLEISLGNKVEFYDFMQKYFNLSKKTLQHYHCITSYFMEIDESSASGTLVFNPKELGDYSISKIQELCTLYVWQVADLIESNIINPAMPRDTIRKIVSITHKCGFVKLENYLNLDKSDNKSVVEPKEEPEEEHNVFDVNSIDLSKCYDVEFFQKLDKSDLVVVCLKYQELYVNKK